MQKIKGPLRRKKKLKWHQFCCLFGMFCVSFFNIGCSEIQYYWQAVKGHIKILNNKQSIQALLEAPQTSPELVSQLKLILDVRNYAVSQLSLPQVYGYTDYADIGKSHVSNVVLAAYPLKLESYEWCFLFVGCVEYRGYFDEKEAQQYAEILKQQGLDVSIGKVRAYSTLGWLNNPWVPAYFNDPVLNTFFEGRSETNIISILIHEMAHQVVYIRGDTSFNESFAVFVEQEGLRQYLETKESSKTTGYQVYLQEQHDEQLFRNIISAFLEKFETLYASPLADAEKIVQKQQLFYELQQSYLQRKSEFQILSYDNWFSHSLNNANLLSVKRYHNYVEAFAQVYVEEGKNWEKFFLKVKAIADYLPEELLAFLEQRLNTSDSAEASPNHLK
ncbi:aminopeptidase [Deltaproteobacteria bacterium TL4]